MVTSRDDAAAQHEEARPRDGSTIVETKSNDGTYVGNTTKNNADTKKGGSRRRKSKRIRRYGKSRRTRKGRKSRRR